MMFVSLQASRPATTWENLITLLGGIWVVAGLFVDGYAHVNIIDAATEDFFTPWHAFLYSGFVATAAWIGFVAYRRRRPGPIKDWFPPGYLAAAVGVVVFTVGGVADMIWHTIFGIELDIDALLSPSHIVLMIGFLLILTTPMRAVELAGGSPWLAAISLAATVAVPVFFTPYANGLDNGWFLEQPFPQQSFVIQYGLASGLFVTALLSVSAVYFLKRWRPPIGSVAVIWAVPLVLETFLFGDLPWLTGTAVAAGGLTVELVARASMPSAWVERYRIPLALCFGMFVLWSVYTLMEHLVDAPVRWAPELWTGQIVICALLATMIGLVGLPPTGRDAKARIGADVATEIDLPTDIDVPPKADVASRTDVPA